MEIGLIQIGLVGVPAVLVASVPRRWLPVVMVLWFISPIIAYAGEIGLEMLLRPRVEHPVQTAFYGFMLASPLLAPPWLLACLVGFGIGFALRRVVRPARIGPAAPAARVPAAPVPSPARERGVKVPPPASARPIESWLSPDGTIRVDLAGVEWSNSHWVMSPRVTDVAGGRTVLDLLGTDWDAEADFPRPRCVRLSLRRYRHKGDWTVELDLRSETYQVTSEPGHRSPLPAGKLAEVVAGLEAATDRADNFFSESRDASARAWGPRPRAFAAWRTALVILAGAIVAIVALTYLIGRPAPSFTRSLTPLPAMPPNPLPSDQH